MRLAITAPLREIDVGKNNLIRQIGLSMILITILALILTILLTRRLIRPLQELNIAAQKIAEGGLSITIVHQTHDEVGTLAQSFEKTAEHILAILIALSIRIL